MKKILFILFAVTFSFIAYGQIQEHQIKSKIREYFYYTLDDYNSYEPVSFEIVECSLTTMTDYIEIYGNDNSLNEWIVLTDSLLNHKYANYLLNKDSILREIKKCTNEICTLQNKYEYYKRGFELSKDNFIKLSKKNRYKLYKKYNDSDWLNHWDEDIIENYNRDSISYFDYNDVLATKQKKLTLLQNEYNKIFDSSVIMGFQDLYKKLTKYEDSKLKRKYYKITHKYRTNNIYGAKVLKIDVFNFTDENNFITNITKIEYLDNILAKQKLLKIITNINN